MTLAYRSLLFVPGARPDRFSKAAASGADTIIIDLEDAVLPDAKAQARRDTINWLASSDGLQQAAGVRINSPRTAEGCADIAALAQAGNPASFIMVPKAETGTDIEIVSSALGTSRLVAVVESGRGLSHAMEIAQSAAGGILFGGADYSASLGADLQDWDAMIHARSTIANACGAAGCPAYDVPYLDVKDIDGLRKWTDKARAFGYSGRACIHPDQVAAVNDVFTPSTDDISEARAIMSALESSGGGAVLFKGKLVDRPIILAAERILARARN